MKDVHYEVPKIEEHPASPLAPLSAYRPHSGLIQGLFHRIRNCLHITFHGSAQNQEDVCETKLLGDFKRDRPERTFRISGTHRKLKRISYVVGIAHSRLSGVDRVVSNLAEDTARSTPDDEAPDNDYEASPRQREDQRKLAPILLHIRNDWHARL